MNLQERRQSSQGIYRRVLSVVLGLAIVSLVVYANYSMQVTLSGRMTRKDFMSLWTGAKAIVLGLNPYDPAVWRPLRVAYGCNWNPDQVSPWPHWTHLLFVPLSFFTPEVAGAIWMTTCELSLILGISLLIRISGWEGRSALYVLSGGTFFFRPVFPAIFNGQISPLLFLVLAAAYALHWQGHPFAAGLLFAIQALKPNATAFLLLAVGILFLFRQDWRALAGLLTGGLGLLFVSWCVSPGWLLPWFLGALTGKGGGAFAVPTLWGLIYEFGGSRCWPQTGIVAAGAVYSGSNISVL
ncbi:MAG: glycosyltransferase family 87 protein [Chloroflexota bacterium]|nr:glycosyltransferase family 87 protein [Chloroflexota bacterium]